jgi:hypothetical protein
MVVARRSLARRTLMAEELGKKKFAIETDQVGVGGGVEPY